MLRYGVVVAAPTAYVWAAQTATIRACGSERWTYLRMKCETRSRILLPSNSSAAGSVKGLLSKWSSRPWLLSGIGKLHLDQFPAIGQDAPLGFCFALDFLSVALSYLAEAVLGR